MKCLKCMKVIKQVKELRVNKYLVHIANWGICSDCVDMTVKQAANYVHEYYVSNKDRYTILHKEYRDGLCDSYVANVLADKSSLRGRDIPQEIIKAKKQYMKLNRIIKETSNAKR